MQQPTDIDYKQRYEQAQQTISLLQYELAMLKKMIFGSRHEKFVPSDSNTQQLSLDIRAEQLLTSSVTEAMNISYVRSKVATTTITHPGRHKLPDHLRREEIIIEPVHIPTGSKKIGRLETEVLEYKAAELYVKKYSCYKYLAPQSDPSIDTSIITAALPSATMPKYIAGRPAGTGDHR